MFKKSYTADASSLDIIAEDIENFCEENDVNPADAYAFNLCVDEIFTNIVHYGYKFDASKSVEIEMAKLSDKITLTMRDDAPAFNPLEGAEEPDTSASLEDREIGGLGIFFLKKNMDELSYSRDGEKNILTMSKILK